MKSHEVAAVLQLILKVGIIDIIRSFLPKTGKMFGLWINFLNMGCFSGQPWSTSQHKKSTDLNLFQNCILSCKLMMALKHHSFSLMCFPTSLFP